jgi:hypothetical protein
MCIENYPECGDGGDGCCKLRLGIALDYVQRAFGNRKSIPCTSVQFNPFMFRRLIFSCTHSGQNWAGNASSCIDACCPVCAKADFISTRFRDKGLDELNRMISLPDTRTPG